MIKALFTGRRLWMTLLVVAGAIVMARLGFWQLDRLAQRRAINTRLAARMAEAPAILTGIAVDPEAIEYRRVEARGVYDPSQEIVLRNRSLDGVPGVHVLTPLRIRGSDAAVLIDRGWIPMSQSGQEDRRTYAPPPGEVVVAGVARLPGTGGPQDPPPREGQPRLDAWFQVNIPRIQQQAGYPLLPLYVEQQPAAGDPLLPRRVPVAGLGEGPHMSYAVQWFAFSVILIVGYVVFTRQQIRQHGSQPAVGGQQS